MSRRFPHYAMVSLLVLLLLSLATPAGDGLLRFRPKEGKVYRYEMVTTQDMDMNLGPMGNQTMKSVISMTTSQTIREVRDDGTVLVDIEYESASMKISTPLGELGEAGPDLNELLTGHVFQVEYSERGEILDVSGFNAVFSDLLDGTMEKAPQLKEMLSQSFSDDAMKMMMQQATPVFPADVPIAGFVWTHEAEMANPILGSFKLKTTYGHKGVERRGGKKCFRMDLEIAMEIPEELPLLQQIAEMLQAQGVKMEMDMSMDDVEGAGSMWTDRKSGMLVEGVMNQHMDIKLSMTMTSTAEDAPEPTTMDFSIGLDQEIRTTLLQ